MATEIKIWEVNDKGLQEIAGEFAAEHIEKDLEGWITNNPSLLGGKLLPIKRQHEVPQVGILDLLCIDENGKLVVVEFKRDMTSREAVAQALDYASWLDSTSDTEILSVAQESLGKPLEDAFLGHFGSELQSLSPQNHRILVVAPRLDSSAERIINYLADRYGVDLNAVFFRYAKTSAGQNILVRTVLVQDKPGKGSESDFSAVKLHAMAKERATSHLLDICRTASHDLWEEAVGTYKGSFRYWLACGSKERMVFGVNVSGERDKAPLGELHVWIPPKSVAELTGIPETDIRNRLTQEYLAHPTANIDIIIRLQTVDHAKMLVSDLHKWAAVAKKQEGRAAVSSGT